MAPIEHENYAKDLLFSLSDDHPETELVNFVPDTTKSRNAAGAMTAILCQRLFKKSKHRPMQKENKTYEWKEGIFISRNIADRDYLWTNIRRDFANAMHDTARSKPVAYLLACSNPSDATLFAWAIREPLLHDSLSSLPLKKGGQAYTLQIRTDKQRIEHFSASPDLTEYFQGFQLSRDELRVLNESREVDATVKRERAIARGEEETDDDDGVNTVEAETRKLLAIAGQHLNEAGVFNPEGIADARERVLSSIVRRGGQPAFRHHLLAVYNGRCAITGCDVEAVLDAAHIVPFKGPDTNHPGNGLLLRTDLHTLFDLKLVAVDVETNDLARFALARRHLLRGVSREADHRSRRPRKSAESAGARTTLAGKQPVVQAMAR
jgi:hypothetical protein